MGLFDMFKGSNNEEMTPKLAFAAALLYMMSADGQIEEEEVGQLISALGGDRATLDAALKYARKNPVDAFLPQAAAVLSESQKLCILTNLADSLLADGNAAAAEQALFNRFLSGFGIGEEQFRPYFEVIVVKNDRSVFNR
ncbi:TerB family tellurite resistance protein [Dechloromonas sp. ZY10]|uniref:tellurite resistance TerB family protein n=1 Tax=Dechloromonas aquae TaxID=2664436 RepID=UPI00352936D2